MMRMQTEGETPMEMTALFPQQPVACGGAARKLDVKKLTEVWKRDRTGAAADSAEVACSTAPAEVRESIDEVPEIDVRRRALRRTSISGTSSIDSRTSAGAVEHATSAESAAAPVRSRFQTSVSFLTSSLRAAPPHATGCWGNRAVISMGVSPSVCILIIATPPLFRAS